MKAIKNILILLTIIFLQQQVFSQNAGDDQTVCDSSAVMQANDPSPLIGTWSIVAGSGTFSDINDPNATVSGLALGDNIFRWTVDASFDDVTITNSAISVDAGEGATIDTSAYMLQATALNMGESGVWSIVAGSGNFANDTEPNTAVSGLGFGSNICRWTVSNASCVASDDVEILRVASAGNDTIISGSEIFLKGELPEGAIGEWTIMMGTGNFDDEFSNETWLRNITSEITVVRWTVTIDEKLTLWHEITITRDVSGEIVLTQSENLKCYPNPTVDILNICSNNKISSVEIVAISGRKIYFEKVNSQNTTLNLENLPKGMYFVKIRVQNGEFIKQIFVY